MTALRQVFAEFDHHSPDYFRRRFAWFEKARELGPVFWTPNNGGHWVVIGLRELAEATKNWQAFSSAHLSEPLDGVAYTGSFIPPKTAASLLNEDPPEWNALRQALAPRFAVKAMEPLRAVVQQFTDDCLDARIEAGRIDLVNDVCNVVPSRAVMALAGLPPDDAAEWSRLLHAYVSMTDLDAGYQQLLADMATARALLSERVAAQREEPVDGLIGHLIQADIGGRRLSDGEIAGVVRLVIGGGVDTTASVMAASLAVLSSDHRLRDEVLTHGVVHPAAVEELLRWATPTQGMARTVREDVVLGGQHLRRGDRVMLCFAAANRDPTSFDDPASLRPDRAPNRHVAFGSGLHRCIGAPLARIEMEVVITTCLTRLANLAVDVDATLPYPNAGVVAGYITMPATFTPSSVGG